MSATLGGATVTTAAEVAVRRGTDEAGLLRELKALDPLVLRLLSRDPAERGTVEELERDLQQLLA
ncbi:MAG TPA: hypothetical protein VGV61_05535 [Thermoanaerobaculia bacterium]|nr:hypothetical protein [Thermoanaerobaculia bacterium]